MPRFRSRRRRRFRQPDRRPHPFLVLLIILGAVAIVWHIFFGVVVGILVGTVILALKILGLIALAWVVLSYLRPRRRRI